MNIEQITIEVADELYLDKITIGYNSTEFLRRCLEKLAEQNVNPFGYLCDWGNDSYGLQRIAVYYGEPGSASVDDWNEYPKIHENLPIYTETQLITAQLQVAKACVNLCKTLKETKDTQQHSQWNAGIDLCIDQLSSNEWMGHL